VKFNHPEKFAELPHTAWPTTVSGNHSYTLSNPSGASITVLVNKRAFYVKPVPEGICKKVWTGKRDKAQGVLVAWGVQSAKLAGERLELAKKLAQWT